MDFMDSLYPDEKAGVGSPIDPRLRLGTSSFSHGSWVGSFYPIGTKPADFLGLYARKLDTVEIDATFYRSPTVAQARSWAAKVPAGFRIALKVPRTITHEKLLLDCDDDLDLFLEAADAMEDRLGPLLFQFPYFQRNSFPGVDSFLARLAPVLDRLSPHRSYAVEIRNKGWIGPSLLDLLRGKGVALALIDHPWMAPVEELLKRHDVVTAGFTYVRWLGDRHEIEARTTSWDRVIVDRSAEMERWAAALASLLERDIEVYGYFNNHYAGHAPGSIELLRETWRRRLAIGGAT